jgi:hypothetical protein
MTAEVPAVWALAAIATGVLVGCALIWVFDRLDRRAFEATLSQSERERFSYYRLVLPWRNFAKVVEIERVDSLVRALYETIKAEIARHAELEHDGAMSQNDALRVQAQKTQRLLQGIFGAGDGRRAS